MDRGRRRNEVERTVRHLLEKYRRAGGDRARVREAEAKKDYILPLFRSLGWDVENGAEVTAEERVSRGFVDYGFRADNMPMFYLEAKGMNVKNMEDGRWISQAVNYSWLKAVPWAVLTNFRVLKVLNAEARVSTPASVQFFEIKCEDMLDPKTLDKLLLLSRESLVDGTLDGAAREWGALGPTMPVDKRLYEDLFKAREMLMRSVVRNNTGLTRAVREESVERTLSRLVFVRALEDRGLSEPILMPLVREAEGRSATGGRGAGRGRRRDVAIRDGLRRAFRRLDGIYNASLFAPHPCDRLDITDYALTRVINMLHASADQVQRYDFSVLDVDVLGGIYEQYLGAIAAGRAAGGKGGTAHRQARGIYYTPSSIVGFMVDVLVRHLVEDGQDPDTIRVCDPSCGSGTFLVRCVRAIAAARCEKAAGGGAGRRTGGPAAAPSGEMLRRMTVRTIEENVFGIDLDRTAVERARLNLFLCEVGRDRRLPNVHETVRLGNSLMDRGVRPGVEPNPFPWDLRFAEKFDAMVGNPPYIRNRRLSPVAKAWFAGEYASASGQYDAYVLFVERALAKVRDGGYVVFITSNKYAAAAYGAALRRHILDTARIRMIVDVSDSRVFPEPDVYPWIIVLQKEPSPVKRRANTMLVGRAGSGGGAASPYACRFARIPQARFEDNADNIFYVDAPGRGRGGGEKGAGPGRAGEMGGGEGSAADGHVARMVLDALDRGDGTTIPMGSFTIREAVHTGNVRKKILLREGGGPAHRRVIRGKDMGRYCHEWGGYWLDTEYEPSGEEYMRINDPELFRGKKLFLRDIADRIAACYDDSGLYSLNTLFVIRTDQAVDGIAYDPLYVLAVLNSSLMSWYFAKKFGAAHVAAGYLRYKKQYVEKLPVKAVPPKRQASIVRAVKELHRLVRKRAGMAGAEGTDRWREVDESIRRQDEAIDGMISRLYGLNDAAGRAIRKAVPPASVRVGAAPRARSGAS